MAAAGASSLPRRRRLAAPLHVCHLSGAALPALLRGGGAGGKAAVTEPETGLSLPGEACEKAGSCHAAHVGVRKKRIAGLASVKVYAVGLYVDTKKAAAQLGARWKGKPADDALFMEVAKAADVYKRATLVFARNVKGAAIKDALSEYVEPALGPFHPAALEFNSYFEGVTLKKGSALSFTASGGSLATTLDGKELGTIPNALLCEAIFTAYLGPKAVAPAAKQALGATLAAAVAN